MNAKEFIIDYCQRHAHPTNAVLHLVGVPLAFFGLYRLFTGEPGLGWAALIGGYVLQYIGHQAQGNEVGEVTLIKAIVRGIKRRIRKGTGKDHA